MKSFLIYPVLITLLLLPGGGATAADLPGITDKEIRIGNTGPYSGPASVYSIMLKSAGAWFDKVNAEGGINGRKVKFISLDDGYSPPKTKEQVRKLVEKEKVALIFMSLGTACNSAVQRYLNRKKVPQLFIATGASKWNNPGKYPWTMGWQGTYDVESEIYAKYILQHRPNAKIAILYQNDDFGKDYVAGLERGLGDQAQKMIVSREAYEPTDPTVDSQIIKMKASGADVFLNIATPKHASQAIRKVHELKWQPLQFMTSVSISVAGVMKPVGFDKTQGILSTRYFLDPYDPAHAETKAIKDWQAFMKEYYPEGDRKNAFNVYGYLVAQTLEHVLRRAGNDLSRENIMKQAASLKDFAPAAMVPGITLNTSSTDYRPVESMELIRFKGDRWHGIGQMIRSGNDMKGIAH